VLYLENARERHKRDLVHVRSCVPDCLELARQRMRRRDFVVSVRANQQQVRHAGWSQQIFEEIERRVFSRGREWDISGFQAIHPVPLPRSATPAEPMFLASSGLTGAAPAAARAKASACYRFRGYRGASAPAVYASRVMLPSPMQDSLPAGWLAFTGRGSNPLDRGERFPSFLHLFPFPGFILTLRCNDCVP
jgi:hypothetical protein